MRQVTETGEGMKQSSAVYQNKDGNDKWSQSRWHVK